MRLMCCRDNGTIAIPFKIEQIRKSSRDTSERRCYFRVTFAFRYPVDLIDVDSYNDVFDLLQKTYNCLNLNFDTVELC
jgi:hypothetical protein